MREPRLAILDSNRTKLPCGDQNIEKKPRKCGAQTMDKKLFSPAGKIAIPANEGITESLILLFRSGCLLPTNEAQPWGARQLCVLETLLERILKNLRKVQSFFKRRVVQPFRDG